MKKILARTGLVLAVAGAAVAPQAWWLLGPSDRDAMTAVEVEAAAAQQYAAANAQLLDRIECEPIRTAPGTSRCEAQEADRIFGLVLELAVDGGNELSTASAQELPSWSDG